MSDDKTRKATITGSRGDMERVPVTDQLIDTLKDHQQRTGVGPAALLSGCKDSPGGLTGALIRSWMKGGTRSARRDYLEYVVRRWASLKDDPTIPITPSMRRELRVQIDRTGLGVHSLLKGREDRPEGVTGPKAVHWHHGKQKRVRKDHWRYVMGLFEETPSADSSFVTVTPYRRAQLAAEKNRTGISSSDLLRDLKDVPTDLTPETISGWLCGVTKQARPEHLSYVLEKWAQLPDSSEN